MLINDIWSSMPRVETAAAKSLQSCLTLCDPIDSSPPGFSVPGILQARILEWVAISFSNAWSEKWKWSHSIVSDSLRPHGLEPTRLLHPWDFPGKSTGVSCHCLLPVIMRQLYLIYYFCYLFHPFFLVIVLNEFVLVPFWLFSFKEHELFKKQPTRWGLLGRRNRAMS